MKRTYTEYFQKSKVFLYPLLGIKKGIGFVPTETYFRWNSLYTERDYKFICVYDSQRSLEFKNFELKHLKFNKHLEFNCQINERQIYVFDMISYKKDFDCFLEGKYSKFSTGSKSKIINYFENNGRITEYIKSFLEPTEYHQIYADFFSVKLSLIKTVHEICNKPDFEKETLFEKIPYEIELLKNNSLYLNKNQY